MKKKINFISIVLIFFCVFSVANTIYDTFAKYISSSSGNTQIDVALWKIFVNSHDVSSGETVTLTNNMNIVLEDSNLAVSGKIAPNRSGSFEIQIDPSDTEVAIEYDLAMSLNYENTPSNVSITGYQIKTGDGEFSPLISGTTVNGTIDLPGETNNKSAMTSDQITTIKVFINWLNDDNDNLEDTSYGEGDRKSINVPITLLIKQDITP